jgi:hypothetical protein
MSGAIFRAMDLLEHHGTPGGGGHLALASRPNARPTLRPQATHPRLYGSYDFLARAARPRDLIRSASCRLEVLS